MPAWLRKTLVGFAAVLLGLCLYSMVISASVSYTLRASNVKQWLADSGIYNNLIDGALEAVQKNQPDSSQNQEIPLTDPAVQKIIASAFTPQFLQKSSEAVIDGTFKWLNKEVKLPEFTINIGEVKTSIINSAADYARSRYNSLPVCPGRTLPSSTDIFQINCRPAVGFDLEAMIGSFKQQLASSKEFLPNATIDSSNLSLSELKNSDQRPVFERLNNLPDIYGWLKLAPFIFGVLALGLAAGVVLGSVSRRAGLKKTAIILLSAGLLLLLGVILTRFGLSRAEQAILDARSSNSSPIIQKDVIKIVRAMSADLAKPTLWFSILFVTAAIGAFIYLLTTRQKGPKVPAKSPEELVQT